MHRGPVPTVDVIIEVEGKIVLVRRKHPPEGWAIPGGFIDPGERAEEAAVREAREETGLSVTLTALLGVYSDPARDARRHTISTVYIGAAEGTPSGGDDASEARWISLEEMRQKIGKLRIGTESLMLFQEQESG